MNGTTGTAAQTTLVLSSKEARQKFGVNKAPLAVLATCIGYRKDTNFDEQFSDPTKPNYTKAESWLIVDPTTNKVRRATTYNQNLGKNEDYNNGARITDLPKAESKEHRKMFKGYIPCDLSQIPFITVTPTGDEVEVKETTKDEVTGNTSENNLVNESLSDENLNDDGAPTDENGSVVELVDSLAQAANESN